MRLVVLSLPLLASLCIHPDAYCPGGIEGETLEAKVQDALEDCAPMVRVRVRW